MSVLEPCDFAYISTLVVEKTGVRLTDEQHDFVRKRVLPIAREGGFDEIADLVDQLQMSPNSKLHSRVIESVLDDETMFFRDFSSYKFLRHEVCTDLFEKRGHVRELNVWCGACSTGQEAFSISIMLNDALAQFKDWKITLLATDIAPSRIKKAKSGEFGQEEINRGLPAGLLLKHFDRDGTHWKIHQEHVDRIQFRVFNLMHDWDELPIFDIILMRNILGYFPKETQQAINDKLVEHMHEDTYLFLSANEAPVKSASFFLLKSTEKDACYQLEKRKTEDAEDSQEPPPRERRSSKNEPDKPKGGHEKKAATQVVEPKSAKPRKAQTKPAEPKDEKPKNLPAKPVEPEIVKPEILAAKPVEPAVEELASAQAIEPFEDDGIEDLDHDLHDDDMVEDV